MRYNQENEYEKNSEIINVNWKKKSDNIKCMINNWEKSSKIDFLIKHIRNVVVLWTIISYYLSVSLILL